MPDALDPELGSQLREIQHRIATPQSETIAARWEFGRALLAVRGDQKQLPNGTLAAVMKEFGIGRTELRYRIKFAERYPDLEVVDASTTSKSWYQITHQLLVDKKRKKKKVDPAAVAAAAERKRLREQRERLRNQHAENLYQAMRNAPRGAISLPMLNRATRVIESLYELSDLDPHEAANSVPSARCREYAGTEHLVDWWIKFSEACEERRRTETPKLQHFRRNTGHRLDANAPSTEQVIAVAVLDLLASHERATEAELGVGIATADIGKVLRQLVAQGRLTYNAEDGTYEAADAP